MKYRILAELDIEDYCYNPKDPEDVEWFREDILYGDKLYVHSNEIGDSIGEIQIVKIFDDLDDETWKMKR